MKNILRLVLMGLGTILLLVCVVGASPSEISVFDQEHHKIKYSYAYSSNLGIDNTWDFAEEVPAGDEMMMEPNKKSPAKAFLLSLAVPGLGQYYYGSKVKSAAFLGIEAASWLMHVKWHGDGNQLEDEFEEFNRTHWIQGRYEDYLEINYGARDDDSISAQEVSHNLPKSRTQQYYEMTGKYDQFAWGWDDAILYDTIQYNSATQDWGGDIPPAIIGPSFAPTSERRNAYEVMRNNANNKLDNANKMLMVVLANHVLSAMEAFISTKSLNKKFKKAGEFSNWKVRPTLKSYNHRRDTPYLKVTYKF